MALEEIVVTARKREENLQDIPADVQAISQIMLQKMGANGIEDYARFIPSVNVVSYSPGETDVVFRGVNTGSSGVSPSPSSMYLDEVPITTTGSQPEVRMVDINRVEALAGPQGTLFGGSAQSGTLRVITNQPDPTQFEASAEVTFRQGSDTASSHDVNGMLNLPMGERAAIRLVGFTATDGGFIDNVFGHTPDTHEWYTLPATWGVEDNAEFVKDDWNETDFNGGRIALRYDFSDAWAATVGYNYQKAEGAAGNHYDPFVGDLKVVKFNNETREDEWSNFYLTIEGDLGWAQLVSATGYYERDNTEVTDSTVYTKYYQSWACLGQFDPAVYYWQWVDPATGYGVYYPRYCFGPTPTTDVLVEQQFDAQQDKFTQEIRLTGGGDTLTWIAGLFYERTNDAWQSPWGRATNYDYQDSIANAYWEDTWGVGFAPNATHGWQSDSDVDWEQTAIFGELSWRISDSWTATAGGRYFDRTMDSKYFVENPNTQLNGEFVAEGIATASGGSSDFVPKISISYNVSDDKMIYALYSEGFRPGGTNRGRGNPLLPVVYDPDKLKNSEIGFKSIWADGRIRFNFTFYDMNWEEYQLQVVDPSFENGEVWQQVIANAGDASVTGVQAELDFAITQNWNFGMNVISLDAETTSDVDLNGSPDTAEIESGERLPLAPEFKASAWVDFNWETNFVPGSGFARLQFSHVGDSVNQIRTGGTAANPQITTDAYTIGDFRMGLIMDSGWQFDVFVSNLTDERAQYTEASGFFELPFSSAQDGRDGWSRIYTNRPREYGIRISKHWGN